MGFIATVTVKRLGVELAFSISGHLDIFEPASGCNQITSVGDVTVPFTFRSAFSPGGSNEGISLFTHHGFYHDPNGALSETMQVLMEDLLFWEYKG